MSKTPGKPETETQKTVLITGCSTGIGYCVAKGLKQRGYRVIATARRKESVEQLNKEGFESLPLDLSNSESIQLAFKEILQLTDGKLYALFNNGAFGLPGAVEDLSRRCRRYLHRRRRQHADRRAVAFSLGREVGQTAGRRRCRPDEVAPGAPGRRLCFRRRWVLVAGTDRSDDAVVTRIDEIQQ